MKYVYFGRRHLLEGRDTYVRYCIVIHRKSIEFGITGKRIVFQLCDVVVAHVKISQGLY